MKHISDQDFQDYLDGNRPPNDSFIQKHLETCETCRRQLEQYEVIYASLSSNIEWSLPDSFADTVVARLSTKHESRFALYRFLSSDVFLIFTGVVLSLGAVLYFMNYQVFLKPLRSVFSWKTGLIPVFEKLQSAGELFGPDGFTYLLSGGLILLIVGMIDRLILQYWVGKGEV